MLAKQLGTITIEDEELKKDKKHCKKYGPCGVGEKALYLNSFYVERRYYIAIEEVERVFKRVAMSKGGFTGKGVFGSIPYFVVQYGNGKEKQCNFKYENSVDLMIAHLQKTNPQLKFVSEAVEERQIKKEQEERKKKKIALSKQVEKEIDGLEKAKNFLEGEPELFVSLSNASRAKRQNEQTNPMYKWVALFITLLGAVTFLYGVYSLFQKMDYALYFTLFGLAAIFFFAGANVLPTARNNKSYIGKQLKEAREKVAVYIKQYPNFPLPEYYAHPIVLKRMIRVLKEGKAKTKDEALEVVKKELQLLNSSVQVEQEEYDEVVAIKPMFLIENYR